MELVVYSIRCTINNKLYIGITNNLAGRWNKHVYDAKHDSQCVIHRAMRKYSIEKFELSIIKKCSNDKELLEQEKLLILQMNTHVSQGGYNETWGGEAPMLGRKHTSKSRLMISEKLRGRVSPYKGRKTTALTKKKLSESHSKSVIQIDLNGTVITTYSSIMEAGKAVGIAGTNISRVCRGKKKTTAGFCWRYEEVKINA